jgi:uncharacterized protein YyaL (SSP411 family)
MSHSGAPPDGAKANRLVDETSPYLLQHAYNPVDWYPWGDEAFEKARSEDKPIFLSVGYSACHWCHVMERESFEDQAVADFLNEHYVSIKVDREERPDVDRIYMDVVQAVSGQGGWPMTVFADSEGRPFFGGTYFPPGDMYGRPGFMRLIQGLNQAWTQDRDRLQENCDKLIDHLQHEHGTALKADNSLNPAQAEIAIKHLRENHDADNGGFGHAPKFPSPTTHGFILSHYAAATGGTSEALELTLSTLDGMRRGGIHDHLGGGFARYSVDAHWTVPHFEKMLYDNAQLVRLYVQAYQITQRPEYQRVARSTLDYMLRDLRTDQGAFCTAEDADSEGIEGKFYVWTPSQFQEVLGEDSPLMERWFGVDAEGNFADPHHPDFGRHTVLQTLHDKESFAQTSGLSVEDLDKKIADASTRLLSARSERIRPGLDDKTLTSWNGLALAAFAEAGRVLNEPRYTETAVALAEFIRDTMTDQGAGLHHTAKDGRVQISGLLEDHSLVGLGLLELYKATGDEQWQDWAAKLWDHLVAHFWDDEAGCFYSTSDESQKLVVRPRSFFDAAMPSDNGSASLLGAWMVRYELREDAEVIVNRVISSVLPMMQRAPNGFGSLWQAAMLVMTPAREVVLMGSPDERAPFERIFAEHFEPNTALVLANAGSSQPRAQGRDGQGRAYLCTGGACQRPDDAPDAFSERLKS